MCGIIGGIGQRNLTPVLIDGLKKLEYRGYDSSGLALVGNQKISRIRAKGKIKNLEEAISQEESPLTGSVGIAHTRWATHGVPSELNAHPHLSQDKIAVVHNGIIENYQELKVSLISKGYQFNSDTDTEVIAHLIHSLFDEKTGLLEATKKAVNMLEGSYALGVINKDQDDILICAKKGSPLVIGVGVEEFFIASDVSALIQVTNNFIFLEDGDVAEIKSDALMIYDNNDKLVNRDLKASSINAAEMDLGDHRHYMHKEIYEQPVSVMNTLNGRLSEVSINNDIFGAKFSEFAKNIDTVEIIACGTSYHAGLVAQNWIEDILDIPCRVEVASEYLHRKNLIMDNTLFVTLSQSGETADTLAALKKMKDNKNGKNIQTLTICNVPESSLVRESEYSFLTQAGPEIGVASTKAFTTQLVALSLMTTLIGKNQGVIDEKQEILITDGLKSLPALIKKTLEHEDLIQDIAKEFIDKTSALFLGRGAMYPIALEGALKLKEISYIHAEAYPAGELKHGPLALVDKNMPVISLAPKDTLLDKLKSNLQEVKARGGQMFVFEDELSDIGSEEGFTVVKATTDVGRFTAPIVFNIALQLLSYHVALIKGTDVDQPRNLAKSVTVQ